MRIHVALFQGMGASQMISLISVYEVYFIADDWSAVFNTIWETEHNNAMTWNEWKTGMELLLVYWMTAVDVSILRAVASASQNEATSAMKRIFCLMEQS